MSILSMLLPKLGKIISTTDSIPEFLASFLAEHFRLLFPLFALFISLSGFSSTFCLCLKIKEENCYPLCAHGGIPAKHRRWKNDHSPRVFRCVCISSTHDVSNSVSQSVSHKEKLSAIQNYPRLIQTYPDLPDLTKPIQPYPNL